METKNINILAFAGSLRKESYNKWLLKEAQKISPEHVVIEIFNLADLPLYNMDLESSGIPDAVNDFRSAIGQADALLIAVPEHNGTISAVLKNAIEWASRRNDAYRKYTQAHTPFYQKPVAFIGASTSHFATIRAQTHLLYICSLLQMLPMSKPNLMLAHAQNSFNKQGDLIDETVKNKLLHVVNALHDWTIDCKPNSKFSDKVL